VRAGAIDAGACQSKSGTGSRHEAASRGQGDGGLHHDVSSPSDVASGIPSKAARWGGRPPRHQCAMTRSRNLSKGAIRRVHYHDRP
jgi:hypothetical protein